MDTRGKEDLYLSLASKWAAAGYWSLLGSHVDGEDIVTLCRVRLLITFIRGVEAEAKKRGRPQEWKRASEFVAQLPKLEADLERRARTPRRAVVCIGPGREPDRACRIAALIDRLDEAACPFGQWEDDPIVRAIVREGEAAVEPLLRCADKDQRFSRSPHRLGDDGDHPIFEPVHEVAMASLRLLFHLQVYDTRFDWRVLSDNPEVRKARVDEFREYWKKVKGVPFARRWLDVLANDREEPEHWSFAASTLLARERNVLLPSLVFRGAQTGKAPSYVADALKEDRGRLTELLGRRIEQILRAGRMPRTKEAGWRAWQLADWAGRDARPYLESVARCCAEEEDWEPCALLTEARVRLGDRKALWDYARWLRGGGPSPGGIEVVQMGPLWQNPEHPAVTRVARWMFHGPHSTWAWSHDAGHALYDMGKLACSPLVRVAGFRQALLSRLGDKGKGGTFRVEEERSLRMSLAGDVLDDGSVGADDPEAPAEGTAGEFRVCDYLARAVALGHNEAPRCELYWPVRRRDAAVAACIAYLKRWGGDVHFPPLARPATAEDVREGRAVFSLTGNGTVRTLRLPRGSLHARWTTLKDGPSAEEGKDTALGCLRTVIRYRQEGRVVQAEEVRQGGVWRRYYGFVGSHRVARVPAEEIEFSPPDPEVWLRLGPAFHGQLDGPPPQDEELNARLAAGKAVPFTLKVYNHSGLDHGLAELKGVRLRAWYSPEVVSRQGALKPAAREDAEWIELKAKAGARFAFEAGKTVRAGEQGVACRFDLRDWFDVSRAGFYRVWPVPAEKGAKEDSTYAIQFSVAPRD
jgi:hypothetical protein